MLMRKEQLTLKSHLLNLIRRAEKTGSVAIDTETETLHGKPIAVSLATDQHSLCLLAEELNEENRALLTQLFQNKFIKKIFHNALYDFEVLNKFGFQIPFPYEDTLVLAKLLDSAQSGSLDALAYKYLNEFKISAKKLAEEWKPKKNVKASFAYIPRDVLKNYASKDAELTLKLFHSLWNLLTQEMKNTYLLIERPLVFVLYQMNRWGIGFNKDFCCQLDISFRNMAETIKNEILSMLPKKINIDSTQQLAEVLFKDMGLICQKKTKKGKKSVDQDSLELIEDQHPVIKKILEYRQLKKLITTYTTPLPEYVQNGRIHPYLSSTITASGRLASSRPNLQNIPIQSDLGRKIRQCFIPEDGKIFVIADYSQIELRVLAHLANDPIMISVFKSGGDIHAETAKLFKDIPPDLARMRAKVVNFAMVYGASEYLLSKELGVKIEEAAKFRRGYFEKYPQTKAYLDYIVDFAKKYGYVSTILGRRRYLQESEMKSGYGERIALNTPVQGSAADIVKAAMVNIFGELKHFEAKMVLQIHDELIFELTEDRKEDFCKILKDKLINLERFGIKLSVPLEIKIGFGKNWQEAKA